MVFCSTSCKKLMLDFELYICYAAEEKAYSCLFQHDGFRPTKTIEITPWLSFFHTLPWLLTHPQNIDICEKPLSLWRNLGTSLNRNISMCWNTRPLRGALTMFLHKDATWIELGFKQWLCFADIGSKIGFTSLLMIFPLYPMILCHIIQP